MNLKHNLILVSVFHQSTKIKKMDLFENYLARKKTNDDHTETGRTESSENCPVENAVRLEAKQRKLSPRHFCSQLYPRGIQPSDYLVFGTDRKRNNRKRKILSRTSSPEMLKKRRSLEESNSLSNSDKTSIANTLCVICYCRLSDTTIAAEKDQNGSISTIASLPCNHTYHKKCLARWMELQKVCPICRKPT